MVCVDSHLATSIVGVFAAGDAVSGPSTIIDAIAQGRQASQSIDRFRGGDGQINGATSQAKSRPEITPEIKKRQRIEPKKAAKSIRCTCFALVETAYDTREAMQEAERCLACETRCFTVNVTPERCKECGYCLEVCHMGVFGVSSTFNASGYKPTVVANAERCVGCMRCFTICPDFAISVIPAA